MPARIIHNRDEVLPGETTVGVRFYRMMEAGVILAVVEFRRQNNLGTRIILRSAPEKVVASALDEARHLADRYGAETILVNDMEGLYTAPPEPA